MIFKIIITVANSFGICGSEKLTAKISLRDPLSRRASLARPRPLGERGKAFFAKDGKDL